MTRLKIAGLSWLAGAIMQASLGTAHSAPLTPLSLAAKPKADNVEQVRYYRWGGWGAGALAGAVIGSAIAAPYYYGGYYPYRYGGYYPYSGYTNSYGYSSYGYSPYYSGYPAYYGRSYYRGSYPYARRSYGYRPYYRARVVRRYY